MPNAPRQARADRIAAHLHLDERESIEEWCRRHGVPIGEWPERRAAGLLLDLAIGRAVDAALRSGRARSRTAALRIVCGDFGLDGDSVRKRWQRTEQKEKGRIVPHSDRAA